MRSCKQNRSLRGRSAKRLESPPFSVPSDLFGFVSKAIATAYDKRISYILLSETELLHIMGFPKTYKVGGVSESYACMEWPGIQISHDLFAMMGDISLLCHFSDDEGQSTSELHTFYDRKTAGKGLDLGEGHVKRKPFLRYSAELNFQHSVKDIVKTPLRSVEDIAYGIFLELQTCDIPNSSFRKDFERALRKADAYSDYIPNTYGDGVKYNCGLNSHIGAARNITLGRVQDPEGTMTIVTFFQHPADAIAIII